VVAGWHLVGGGWGTEGTAVSSLSHRHGVGGNVSGMG
jgi:hypothetical protein